MDELEELGPVDYLVVEFPTDAANFTGEMAAELAALAERGTVRLLDMLILRKDDDGSIEAFEIDDLEPVDELVALEGEIADILAAEDVAHLAEAMTAGTAAGVIVWENAWAAPFASTVRRSGGQLVATGKRELLQSSELLRSSDMASIGAATGVTTAATGVADPPAQHRIVDPIRCTEARDVDLDCEYCSCVGRWRSPKVIAGPAARRPEHRWPTRTTRPVPGRREGPGPGVASSSFRSSSGRTTPDSRGGRQRDRPVDSWLVDSSVVGDACLCGSSYGVIVQSTSTRRPTLLAYDYPLLGLFWSMLMFFLFFAWLILLFRVFADIFRSDMGGVAKGVWSIFVILVPFLGVLIYVIAHGDGMRNRDIAAAQQNEAAFQTYVQQAAGSGGVASELSKLSDLRASGALTDAEFEAQKAKLLAT